MPRHIVPMMATTAPLPRDEQAYGFEIKWDGVRAIGYLDGDGLQLESRNLNDITRRYPELQPLVEALAGRRAVLDGEVVAFDPDTGRPSFQQLQRRMHLGDARAVQEAMVSVPVMYVLFDVLWLDGADLMDEPYAARREALDGLALSGPAWQTPASHPGEGTVLRDASVAQGLEGIVAKRLDSRYESGRRSRCWIKVKNVARQEVVVGGWLPGEGTRHDTIGALVVGYYDGDQLRFAGKVGTGFTERMLRDLEARFAALARDDSPFDDPVPWKKVRWVEPQLVADVAFTEWTHAGTLRHPAFKGLRDDKPARAVVREPSPPTR